MPEISLPSDWQPRAYQRKAWDYLEGGGLLAYLIWHRRSGKDDMALRWTSVSAFQRVGTYWHMLPQASQARKAIWEAVNPETGRRRIDEAFPIELREVTRENEMFIRFVNGSTWQVLGSDNYDALVGSPPIGLVLSEWALAKPQAWAYLSPILLQNGGWALFITTPRGNNHAARQYNALLNESDAFVELLKAPETGVFTPEQLEKELRRMIAQYGPTAGRAHYEQEYLCSFSAANLGAIFAKELLRMREDKRIRRVPYEPSKLVSTAWDIGRGDPTAIWFYQWVGGELRVIDFYESKGDTVVDHVAALRGKGYRYDTAWLPHDAEYEHSESRNTFADLMRQNGFRVQIAPKLSVKEGIDAARLLMGKAVIDADRCRPGIEALEAYEWDYNARLDEMKDRPLHNWASHASDAWRYLAVSLRAEKPAQAKKIHYDPRGIV
jgi:phage terminase large subunit